LCGYLLCMQPLPVAKGILLKEFAKTH